VEDEDCNIPCAGREDEMCGGSNLVFAYLAGFKDTLPEASQVGGAETSVTVDVQSTIGTSATVDVRSTIGTSVTLDVQSTISTDDGQPNETANAEGQSSGSTDSENGAVPRDGLWLRGCIISVLTALKQLM
ncbi:hypothetical protein ACHAQH_010024, partial [Verticillium albo-atrum]